MAVRLEVGANRLLQCHGASVRPAAELPLCEKAEEAFELVDPGRAGRGEVDMESGMTCVAGADGGRFVGAGVVQDEVNFQVRRRLGVDALEEPPELHSAVAPVELADHATARHLQRCEKSGRAVADVVVRALLGHAEAHRQNRLRPVQRPDLRLLVGTKDQGSFRRVQVQARDVTDLLDEERIFGEFESLAAARDSPEP